MYPSDVKLIYQNWFQEDVVFDNNKTMHGYAEKSSTRVQAEALFPDDTGKEPELGNKVFQLIFAGLDGSTFPVGYFPVKSWNSIDILSTIGDAIEMLHKYGFVVCKGRLSKALRHK